MSNKNYDTIRGLEGQYLGLFKKAGILVLVGLLVAVFGMHPLLIITGIVLSIIGVVIFIYGMAVMMKLQREPTRTVYCPYCSIKNDVFVTRQEFSCDVCNRRIRISPSGEPIPIEPTDDDDE